MLYNVCLAKFGLKTNIVPPYFWVLLFCLDGLHIGEGWTAALMGDVRFACCALSRGAAIDPAAIPFGLDVADSWASPLACPSDGFSLGHLAAGAKKVLQCPSLDELHGRVGRQPGILDSSMTAVSTRLAQPTDSHRP